MDEKILKKAKYYEKAIKNGYSYINELKKLREQIKSNNLQGTIEIVYNDDTVLTMSGSEFPIECIPHALVKEFSDQTLAAKELLEKL